MMLSHLLQSDIGCGNAGSPDSAMLIMIGVVQMLQQWVGSGMLNAFAYLQHS